MARKKVPEDTQTEVLTRSRRRCCFCYYVDGVEDAVDGQIAHLDQDPNNNEFGNLAWLCLHHHDRYDSKTSQSKGLTRGEVVHYRDRLYEQFEKMPTPSNAADIKPEPKTQAVREYGTGEFMEYLDGLNGDELYLLAKFILIEKAQTIDCSPNDPGLSPLVAKKFLTRVPIRQSLVGMRDKEPVPYTVNSSVWRHFHSNKLWLLNQARSRNGLNTVRIKALDHVSVDDEW